MPLAGERFATDSVRRVSDRSNKDYADFMSRWDERLGRELSDVELAARQRQPRGDAAHTPGEFEIQQEERKANAKIAVAQQERDRQADVAADVARKHREAQQQMQQEEFALDAMYEQHGATVEEQQRVNNRMVLEKRYGDVTAHWAALAELRSIA